MKTVSGLHWALSLGIACLTLSLVVIGHGDDAQAMELFSVFDNSLESESDSQQQDDVDPPRQYSQEHSYQGGAVIGVISRDEQHFGEFVLSPYDDLRFTFWANYDGVGDGFYDSFQLYAQFENRRLTSFSTRLFFKNRTFATNNTDPREKHKSIPYKTSWDMLENGYPLLKEAGIDCVGRVESFLVDLANGTAEKNLTDNFLEAILSRKPDNIPLSVSFGVYFKGDSDSPILYRAVLREGYSGVEAMESIGDEQSCNPEKLIEEFIEAMHLHQLEEPNLYNR